LRFPPPVRFVIEIQHKGIKGHRKPDVVVGVQVPPEGDFGNVIASFFVPVGDCGLFGSGLEGEYLKSEEGIGDSSDRER
jgi:hypothetical protein